MWITFLAWFFGTFLSKIVYRVMFALGIGFVTYNGIDLLFSSLDASVRSSFGGLSEFALISAKILKLDISASILLSAYSIRLAMSAATTALRSV